MGSFINLIMSYGALDPFLKSYKEKLKLSAFSTKQNRNLLFKELIKHLSANNQLIKVFCQCIREIIEYNAPNKNHKPNQFFIMGKGKKYPINENFKKQFEEFESNVKKYDEARKDFERRKESLIREIEDYCKNQKTLEFNDDILLDNIQQTCKSYTASHVVSNESKDVKSMMCQFYLEKMELLSNSKIRRYQYDDLLKSAKISLWESIKILDNESGARLFPKNLKEIKEKFKDNREKFKQSESVSEIIRYCRECNHYTAFQGLRNRVNFPLKDRSLDEFVPNMREYKELKITDNDLKTTLFTFFDYSSPSEFNQSDWFFRNSLFRKIDFNPYDIWKNLNLDDKKDFAEILKYNMQLKMDSSIAKEFNELLAIAQDSPQDNYQLKIHVRHNNKFYDYSKKSTAYKIKLKIHDCRKSDNQKPIILSEQSSGFQWAFNFMFGFLYNVGSNFSFNHNIIYVMDEPATHLSVPARKEFRKFLKEYAHKNHVTFVLATHDPFLVDTDHLDEIRIVEKEAEGSAIKNNFNYPLNNASKDSDALYQIKRSLGVGQHVFHNPQKHRIIFVEGITDYCYLSAFKLYFNKHNPQFPFTFLPISGLKNNPNDMKETIQKLCELDNNPIVLIDDDRKDGSDPQKAKSEQFKNANEEMHDPIKILQLSDCNEKFKQIEDCFSANDRKKYAKNKRMELAMAFKARLLYSGKDDVMSEETKENFQKLFEWIKKECNNPTIKKEYIKFDYNTLQTLLVKGF
ncbi:hypothetical protein HpM042_02550 [Helicobacter pylori]